MMSFTPTKLLVKLLVLPITAILIIALTACGTSKEREYAYRDAKSIKPVEMPPGLEMMHSKESLEIPEQSTTKLASIEELEKPPTIIDDVDLKLLDDEDAKPASAEKPSGAAKGTTDTATAKTVAPKSSSELTITAGKNTEGNSELVVNQDFDHVFPLVKPALIELGFNIDDASKGGQLYAISKELPNLNLSDKPVHPGDVEPEVKEEFQIHVKADGEQTKITVHNKFGDIEGSGLADHLLLQIKEIMENPKNAPNSNS